MKSFRSQRFKKKFRKLPAFIQERAIERIRLFELDPFNPILGNHPLGGEHIGKRSINVTGDYRIIYRLVEENVALLMLIGTHPELYGK